MVDYPDVPLAPGVPPVPRDPNASQTTESLAPTKPALSNRAPGYGIYDISGASPITVDSFVGVLMGKGYDISTYPVEQGSFESYNKVEQPFRGTLRLARARGVAERSKFLDQLDALCKTTDLYTLVTPERTYRNVNFIEHEYDRTGERGAGMILADVRFMEVRQSTVTIFTETRAPDGAAPVDGGQRQAREPTKEETAAYSAYILGLED